MLVDLFRASWSLLWELGVSVGIKLFRNVRMVYGEMCNQRRWRRWMNGGCTDVGVGDLLGQLR